MPAPQVAICLATYEPDPALFAAQVDSIRAQDAGEWTCVVGDDGSRPESLAAIEATLDGDPRFALRANPDRVGFYRNFERTLSALPEGPALVAFCDQDDRWHPDKLSTLRAALAPGVTLAYSDMRIVDERGATISDTYWTRRRNNSTDLLSLLVANTVSGTASLFRRDLLRYALPFPVGSRGSFHDRWLALVALSLGDLAYVDRPLLDYVQHDDAAIGHAQANRGGAPPRDLAAWSAALRRARSGELARLWRQAYTDGYARTATEARALEQRCGAEMEPAKLRAVRRIAGAECNPLAVPWLQLRSMRRHLGRDETMGVERGLARGVAWKQLTGLRSKILQR